ncbi:MAG: TIR domain-containing protein [Arcobacter sp.]|uniref:TIR domain-containing protein n=1 Tax=Arcobacter sp. TaxID=1872629 RepID=UPI003D01C19B
MTKTEALKKLNTLLTDLNELPPFRYEGDNSLFEKWERKALRYIEEIFKDKNGQSSEFISIDYTYSGLLFDMDDFLNSSIQKHNEGRKKAKTLLESFIEEVNEWKNSPEEDCLNKIKYFIRSTEILTLEDSFKRFGVNEDFDKFKLELEIFLKNTFGNTSDEFNKFKKIRFLYTGYRPMEGLPVPLDLSTYKDGLKSTKILLETILNNINENSLIKTQPTTQIIPETKKTISNKVFIVHGHDELAIVQVSEVLRKLNLEPIILKDEASKSNTIIEKIERLSSDVGFGIVLYTACDIGGKDLNSLQPRARQNVVLEHGYLMAKLGRENTLALKKDNVETPSDIQGLVYTPMDEHKAWQYKLVDELKLAGYNVSKDSI